MDAAAFEQMYGAFQDFHALSQRQRMTRINQQPLAHCQGQLENPAQTGIDQRL